MAYQGKQYNLYKEEFEIISRANMGVICYKGVPLWETISDSLEDYKFYLLDETMYPHGFLTLTCKDEHGDLFHYGRWKTIREAQEWLENPV